MNCEDIKKIEKLSTKILDKENSPYSINKKIIFKIFKTKYEELELINILKLRLTVIDSFYSTNMSKRYFGIEDIAEKMIELFNNKNLSEFDKLMKNSFIQFFEEVEFNKAVYSANSRNVLNLFDERYGHKKNRGKFGRAYSLISKYAYFLTDFKFPIYDSLAKLSLKKLSKRKSFPKSIIGYFAEIKRFKGENKIDSIDDLDKLLWLVGKMIKGNLSTVLNKNDFINNYLSKKKSTDINFERLKDILKMGKVI